eukprot:12349417-Karenia_brevis.AAC.1
MRFVFYSFASLFIILPASGVNFRDTSGRCACASGKPLLQLKRAVAEDFDDDGDDDDDDDDADDD